jgi:hypothetical protein
MLGRDALHPQAEKDDAVGSTTRNSYVVLEGVTFDLPPEEEAMSTAAELRNLPQMHVVFGVIKILNDIVFKCVRRLKPTASFGFLLVSTEAYLLLQAWIKFCNGHINALKGACLQGFSNRCACCPRDSPRPKDASCAADALATSQ